MRKLHIYIFVVALLSGIVAISCDDSVNTIGSSIASSESKIIIDSTKYDLKGIPVINDNYDSRTANLMFGNVEVPEYGSLHCSFVTRFLSLDKWELADTVPTSRVDSCKMNFILSRSYTTGDSLMPQQVTVYRLDKQLPSGLTNSFNPEGYYNPTNPMGVRSYTASSIANKLIVSESTGEQFIRLEVDFPKQFAKDLFDKYKTDPGVFAWPQEFSKFFPGIYVETTFGNGCIANSVAAELMLYYNKDVKVSNTVDGVTTTTTEIRSDSTIVLTTAPEVLSSNCLSYKISDSLQKRIDDGETIITTPGGYNTRITLPIREVIDDYKNSDHNLSIISSLYMNIPATPITNDFKIGVAPYMLLIKTSEINNFFANNKVPDEKTSFYSTYDYYNGQYVFEGLRNYLLQLLAKDHITDDDLDFTLMPVNIASEGVSSGYYGSSTTYYVTQCVPYTILPTMTLLDTKNAMVVFTFTSTTLF